MTPSLAAVALAAAGAGLGQFAVTAIVGDVAEAFGAPGAGDDLTSQIGLTATTLGVALAVIRLASMGALPLTATADRWGRRRTLLVTMGTGLGLTALGALAPGFWFWVAAVALARPWLSTTNALAGVVAAEDAGPRQRTTALAIVAATYGLGAGVVPVVRGVWPDASFRVVTALALLPILLMPLVARRLDEPAVFAASQSSVVARARWLTAVPASSRARLVALAAVSAGVTVATGPGFTYVFVYGEQVLGVSPGSMAVLVLAAGPAGLVGLVTGRWLGDHVGRRPAAAAAMLTTAGGLVVAYRGEPVLLFVGYLVGVASAAAFGPPSGALATEAFPTDVRATAAGWAGAAGVIGGVAGLAAFGALADAADGFAPAATALAVVVLVAVVPLWVLPETLGTDLAHVGDGGDGGDGGDESGREVEAGRETP